jgi:hypothetical protein
VAGRGRISARDCRTRDGRDQVVEILRRAARDHLNRALGGTEHLHAHASEHDSPQRPVAARGDDQHVEIPALSDERLGRVEADDQVARAIPDATVDVVRRMAAAWEPFAGVPVRRHIEIPADPPVEAIADEVPVWLDGRVEDEAHSARRTL